jgi:hypothetical protein
VAPAAVIAVRSNKHIVACDLLTTATAWVLAVCPAGRQVSVVTAAGSQPKADDGSDVVAVLLVDPASQEVTRLERNEAGSFYRIFQANKWVARKKQEREEAEAAAAAAAAEAQQLVSSSTSG